MRFTRKFHRRNDNNQNTLSLVLIYIKAFFKTFSHLFFLLFNKVLKLVKWISTSFGIISTIAMSLTLIICAYGIISIIISGELKFVVNPDRGGNKEAQQAGGNLTQYEKQILMAQALDLDLMNEDFESSDAMQVFFENSITNLKPFAKGHSVQTPAKFVEVFLLVDEVYKHQAINGDSYDSKVNMNFVYGSWISESGFDTGTGKRLYDNNYIAWDNDPGDYHSPLGQDCYKWNVTDLNGMLHMGSTYISKGEYPDLPEDKRAIAGGSTAIFNKGVAFYITGGTTFLRREASNFVKPSDDAYKHLATFSLPGDSPYSYGTKRGFQSWLPDVLFDFALLQRIYTTGYDRDTQNPTGKWGMNNVLACKELLEQTDFTPEEKGLMMDIIANNDRFARKGIECWPNNVDSQSNQDGALACLEMIMIGEGYMEKLCEAVLSDPGLILSGNYDIGDPIFGNCSPSNTNGWTPSDDCYYAQILKSINEGTLKRKYPDVVIERAQILMNYHGNLSGLYTMPRRQGTVRLLYGFGNYAKGHYLKSSLGSMIESYYNYQDENGEYIYRLYEVDFGDETGTLVSATGSGPFGIPYHNEDGTINEVGLICANDLFAKIAAPNMKYKQNITIPAQFTFQTCLGESFTYSLKAGTYPNFWGTSHNGNARSSWGQCTWWSKGRTMLWIYENVSQDEKVWGLYNYGARWAGNKYLSGNGNQVVPVLVSNSKAKSTKEIKEGSVASSIGGTYGHTWFIEAVDAQSGQYYMSHGNISSWRYYLGGFMPYHNGKSKYANPSIGADRGLSTGHGYNTIQVCDINHDWQNNSSVYLCLPDNISVIK